MNRVAQITVQTLRFYRGSTRAAQVDVHDLIETVLALLEARLRGFHIDVVRQFRAKNSIIAQDGEIRQVFANLIGNAMDALPQGGRVVLRTAAARNWKTGARGLAIIVADNGSGMDRNTLEHIFEPFFSTKGITGTGLGLWISNEIVAKHNGSMRVRSRQASDSVGGCTVFRLFLPADSSQEG